MVLPWQYTLKKMLIKIQLFYFKVTGCSDILKWLLRKGFTIYLIGCYLQYNRFWQHLQSHSLHQWKQ